MSANDHSVSKYCHEFNNLVQYEAHHIDTNKKVELFRKGLTIQLQDRLVLFPNLSFSELAGAAVEQEGTIVHTKTLIACMELGRTLSSKVNPNAFLFKATNGS
jgi:hypothetical protein